MSFGAISANAIRALNAGARKGGFSHDTGEGSLSPYHQEMGGDIVWELGSGYFGCRTEDGHFDPDRFVEHARLDQVKMIEIKLSQGAKPGHGGVLPAEKVSREIAQTRGVPMGVDCVSPSRHSAFSTPLELMAFIVRLRELSGGKPVGFKLCIGHPWEFMCMVKAMLATGVTPDFIVVDGAEGGTGAAPTEFSDHIGVPMREGLLFVHNTLVGAGLRDRIKVGVAGKIVSAFDIVSVLAIGADAGANAARGFMFAVGCVQSRSCKHQPLPHRRRHREDPLRQEGAGGAGQGRARLQLPPPDPARPLATCWRPRASNTLTRSSRITWPDGSAPPRSSCSTNCTRSWSRARCWTAACSQVSTPITGCAGPRKRRSPRASTSACVANVVHDAAFVSATR